MKLSTKDFLKKVLAQDGFIYLAYKHEKGWRNKPVSSATDAEDIIEEWSDNRDVYFALATYHRDRVENENGYMAPRRRYDNVKFIKSFWLDIDCGPGKAYPTKVSGLQAFGAFVKASGLPAPSMVVDSGGGLHVYWTVDRPVALDEWKPLAEALKNSCKYYKLNIDMACTADAARVLRPIGTKNHKYPDATVNLVGGSMKDYPLDAFRTPLRRFLLTQVSNTRPGLAPGVSDDLAGGIEVVHKDYLFEHILEGCKAMRYVADTHGEHCSEPAWKATLDLLARCKDGRNFIHAVSDGHVGYSAKATEEKFVRSLEVISKGIAGPPTCALIDQHMGQCSGCPYNGTIKSPIVLGTPGAAGFPPNYKYDRQKVYWVHRKEDGEVERVPVCNYLMSDFQYYFDPEHGPVLQFMAGIKKPNHIIRIPGSSAAGEYKAMAKLVASQGMVLQEWEAKLVKGFVVGYLQHLQSLRDAVETITHYGWVERHGKTGFAVGDTVYWDDGTETTEIKANGSIMAQYIPTGDEKVWRKAASFLVNQNRPQLTAILAASFAAPLVHFSGVSGLVLSAISRESGVGKSSAIKVSQSVWGHPVKGISALHDTANSVAYRMGFLSCLPNFWDELRLKQDMYAFVRLVFQMGQGKDRTRLNANVTMAEVRDWSTLMTVGANESLYTYIDQQGGREPGYYRVFEYAVPKLPDDTDVVTAQQLFAATHSNYGHVGRSYAKWLVTHQSKARETYQKVAKLFGDQLNPTPAERFWLATVALLVTGAMLAKEAGVLTIDVGALAKFLLDRFRMLRIEVKQATGEINAEALLSGFLREMQPQTIITNIMPTGRGRFDASKVQAPPYPPRGEPVAQYARDMGVVRVSVPAFKNWLSERNESFFATMGALKANGVILQELRGVLGHGTTYVTTMRLPLFDVQADQSLAASKNSII